MMRANYDGKMQDLDGVVVVEVCTGQMLMTVAASASQRRKQTSLAHRSQIPAFNKHVERSFILSIEYKGSFS